jgi:catechol 2,3-dioxygenase-like lactoylglutathione lyase family enzyme
MPIVTWDHVHLRSPDPEATAAWLENILGGVIIRGPGRIDVKLGGANVFIAPVTAGDGVNTPPTTPYQGLDHFGLTVKDIDAVAAEIKAKGVEFTKEPTASSGDRKAFRSSCSNAIRNTHERRRGADRPCRRHGVERQRGSRRPYLRHAARPPSNGTPSHGRGQPVALTLQTALA